MKILRSVAAVALLFAFFSSAQAQTQIAGGETFLLGGEQKNVLVVQGRNIGKIAVEISAEKDGKTKLLQVVKPGSTLSQKFGPGEIARFRNISKTQLAVIQFKMTKDVGTLSMRYSQ